MANIKEKLEASRKELLDLGLRNSLLNYRVSKLRSVDVIEESSSELLRLLVTGNKIMSFLSAPEIEEESEDVITPSDSSSTLLPSPTSSNLHKAKNNKNGKLINPLTDLWLQTEYTEKNLHKRLLNIYHHSRTYIQERGFNILYIALGMLRWYEDDNSDKLRKAPLILVPVVLDRTSATEKFKVKYDGEEINENLSLYAKLKNDFGIELPEFPEIKDLDVEGYLLEIEDAISGMPRWSVTYDDVSLGFFSFGKFLMYRDLGSDSWPDDKQPGDHPLLSAMLDQGFDEPSLDIKEDEKLDDYINPDNSNLVVDADSTQLMSILDVKNNRNLVIQGPPGTGKSQTITNIIAEAIGEGKKVLFVAEKMAALEVVKRRLDSLHLGDACLELHSHNARKKEVLEELKRTFRLGKPKVKTIQEKTDLYLNIRDELNNYCEAIHTSIGQSGFTPYQVYGELLKIKTKLEGVELPIVDNEKDIQIDYKYWNRSKLEQWKIQITNLQNIIDGMGLPDDHPFKYSTLKVLLPQDKDQLKAMLADSIALVQELKSNTEKLAKYLGLSVNLVRDESEVLISAAERAINSPHLEGIKLSTGEWQTKIDEISTLITNGERYSAIHDKYDKTIEVDAWEVNLFETRQALKIYGEKWWRIFSGDYRKAKKMIKGLLLSKAKLTIDEQMILVEEIMEASRLRADILSYDALGSNLFGIQWEKEKSNWAVLKKLTEWIVGLYKDVGDGVIPEGIVNFLSGSPDIEPLKELIKELGVSLDEHFKKLENLFDFLKYKNEMSSTLISTFNYLEQDYHLTKMKDSILLITDQIAFNNSKEPLKQDGLDWLVETAKVWNDSDKHLLNFFLHKFFSKLIRIAYTNNLILSGFNGLKQGNSIDKFKELDEVVLKYNRLKLALTHWTNLPHHNGYGQLGILMREFEKKGRHLPIRQLMIKAGNAIQAIKPVFMMSPMSIASFLSTNRESFDLVIFDEASQVKPVDAFGAVLRGKQLVVVGDDKQLPPTSFFDTMLEIDEESEDVNVTSDMESILGLMISQGAPQRMLMWHYRSRHESLIMTSNHEFYNSKLKVFPSPNNNGSSDTLGLSFIHLPNTYYDRGKTRTNPKEAEAVAKAVIEHAKNSPNLTLGVATFSQAQMNAIIDHLEILRQENSMLESFFSSHPDEPFFVKNLESVQGDERDVIYISVGYGKTVDGYLTMNFGALNNNGGERRLNVLITRARRQCVVYSNLTHNDIDIDKTKSRGVLAFKRFLKYAATGDFEMPLLTGGESESVFEEEVANALSLNGYNIKQQVGSAGFFIDIAVVDSEQPGRFLLGIECDGASYHSSRTARDRDRIRQQVLEGLGWQIYRIWSTDWFNNQESELRKIIEVIEQAKYNLPNTFNLKSTNKNVNSTEPILERTKETKTNKEDIEEFYIESNFPINYYGFEFHEMSYKDLSDCLYEIITIEGPIHKELLFKRITELAGVTRIGNRISYVLNDVLKLMLSSDFVKSESEFIWIPENDLKKIRNRMNLPSKYRKFMYVSPHEIESSIIKSIQGALGVNLSSIPIIVVKLLGFSNTSEEMRKTIISTVKSMQKRNILTDGEMININAV